MTLQEIQYKAQGIIHKWRDDDSAPYIEFVEELAHMIVPEPSEDLEEAAGEYEKKHTYQRYDGGGFTPEYDVTIAEAFIAGAKWQAEHTPLPEDTVLFNKGVAEGRRLAEEELSDLLIIAHLQGADQMKEQMMEKAVEGEIQMRYSGGLCAKTIRAINEDKFKFGDRVRIIILPKEAEQ